MAAQLSSKLGGIIGQMGRGADGTGRSLIGQTLINSGLFNPDSASIDIQDPDALMAAAQEAFNRGDQVKATELVGMARQAEAQSRQGVVQSRQDTQFTQGQQDRTRAGEERRRSQRDSLNEKGVENEQALREVQVRQKLLDQARLRGHTALVNSSGGLSNQELAKALMTFSKEGRGADKDAALRSAQSDVLSKQIGEMPKGDSRNAAIAALEVFVAGGTFTSAAKAIAKSNKAVNPKAVNPISTDKSGNILGALQRAYPDKFGDLLVGEGYQISQEVSEFMSAGNNMREAMKLVADNYGPQIDNPWYAIREPDDSEGLVPKNSIDFKDL